MSAAPIRVAVVGVGDFGRNHVRVWREMPGATLVGIIDPNGALLGNSMDHPKLQESAVIASWGRTSGSSPNPNLGQMLVTL